MQDNNTGNSYFTDAVHFNDRFADVTGDLKDGYYNLNGDIYYKGVKVQGGTYQMPTYVTHQDAKTGRTTNTQKKKIPFWVIIMIIAFIAPCVFSVLGTIADLIRESL